MTTERCGRGRASRLALVALAAAALGGTTPAQAGVHAYRISDGAEDPAFVRLGPATLPQAVVPDGHRGAYLVGRIVVAGGERQVVHVLASGRIDPAFRVAVRGGRVAGAAVRDGQLALAGSFTAIGGAPRRGLAVVDARSGRPLRWAPATPWPAHPRAARVAFVGTTLVVGSGRGIGAWRSGATRPTWQQPLASGQQNAAPLVAWRGAVWAAPQRLNGEALVRIDPHTGRVRVVDPTFDRVGDLQVVGDRMLALATGDYFTVDTPYRLEPGTCGPANDGVVVNAMTGDATTLYVGVSSITPDFPDRSSLAPVTACPVDGRATAFHPPGLPRSAAWLQALALVGDHVLTFTQPWK